MVCSGILPENQNHFRFVKVFQLYRTFADAKRFIQCHATAFMAHVTAVGKIVGAELTHKKLVKKGGLIACSARGIKKSFVRGGEVIQLLSNFFESLFPRYGLI